LWRCCTATLSGLPIPGCRTELIQINTSWAQELCIYMFVWMAKFGAAYGVRTGIHVGVDVLVNRCNAAEMAQGHHLWCWAAGRRAVHRHHRHHGREFVMGLSQHRADIARSGMPMWIVYSGIPLGSYLMCFRFLQVAWASSAPANLPQA
jgi:C4-dicarboxylate transporter DctQ subunit